MTPPGNKSFTSSGKLSTLRKLFTKRRARPSLPIHYPQEKSENSAISNVPYTKSSLNQDPEQRSSDQIQRDPNLTLRTIESVLLASEELDTLTSHRQALDSLAAKYKEALAKVQKRKATNDHQDMTEKDEQTFFRVLKSITDAERHAYDVTWKLFSLLHRTIGFDVMMDAERDRKNETRNLVYLLLKLRLDQEYRSPACNAQKQLFEKVAKLCTQFVNERKPDAKDDAPNGVTPEDATKDAAPTKDTAKNDAPKDGTPKDDAPKDGTPKDDALKHGTPKDDALMNDALDGDALDGVAPDGVAPDGNAPDVDALDRDVLYHDAPKQAGESILIVAGRFTLLELEPQTADALGNTEKQILAEITKLCSDFLNFGNDGGKAEMDDSYLAVEEIRGLAKSINKRLGYILAKVEMKPVNQRRELINLVNLNLNRWIDECRKDVKSVEEKKPTGSPQSRKEIGTQTHEVDRQGENSITIGH